MGQLLRRGPSGDHSGPCGQGYIRLADTRYEVRDTQYLLGLLADEGITQPHAIGVTGVSYGGGQSVELAFLNNKIRLPDGKLSPWRSPDGKPMSIAAAYPRWPWTDLIDALLPNGRFLDTQVAPFKQSLNPVGVPIQSYTQWALPARQSDWVLLRRRAGLEPVHERGREHQSELRVSSRGASLCRLPPRRR